MPDETAMPEVRRTPAEEGRPTLAAADQSGWIDDPSEAAATYRRLAVRVIERAFRDVTAATCPSVDRQTAQEFLAGSRMFFHWCRVAALDPRRVMARAATLGKPR
jgi:hypothetical protein